MEMAIAHVRIRTLGRSGDKPATTMDDGNQYSDNPPRRLVVLISGSGTNLQALIDAKNTPTPSRASIVLVLSNRNAAHGLVRASSANSPIPIAYLVKEMILMVKDVKPLHPISIINIYLALFGQFDEVDPGKPLIVSEVPIEKDEWRLHEFEWEIVVQATKMVLPQDDLDKVTE
ncbi:phosphoribosylglycinamide formyltransferase [Scleroderma citrinum]